MSTNIARSQESYPESSDDGTTDATLGEDPQPTTAPKPLSLAARTQRDVIRMLDRRWDPMDYDWTERTVEELLLETRRENIRQIMKEHDEASVRATEGGPPLEAGTLAELLKRPKAEPFRIEGLQPSSAAMLVVAQRKTGKTTLALNHARCLLTGDDFLGRFPVRAISGRVALMNFELSTDQLTRWAHDNQIPPDRFFLANFRGRRNPFANTGDRKELVERLRENEVESIVIDPFGRAFTGKDQNNSGEVSDWLADCDYFTRTEVGAEDLLLTAHAGWAQAGRARGSSALEDWADTILWVTRDSHNPAVRYLRAEGRDVLVDNQRLDFDPATRLMTLRESGGEREASQPQTLTDLVGPVLEAVVASPGLNGAQLEAVLKARGFAFRKGEPGKAAQQAGVNGFLRIEKGQRGAKCYYPANKP